jgi:hypothetical protein
VRHLAGADETLKQIAALALGDSHLESALEPLLAAWNEPVVTEDTRRVLIRALAAHRSDAALDRLLEIAKHERVPLATEVVAALAVYRHNAKLAARLESAVRERADPRLESRFAELWRPAS